jgi:hypothetical protein
VAEGGGEPNGTEFFWQPTTAAIPINAAKTIRFMSKRCVENVLISMKVMPEHKAATVGQNRAFEPPAFGFFGLTAGNLLNLPR